MPTFQIDLPVEYLQPTAPSIQVCKLTDSKVATVGEYGPEIALTMQLDRESYDRMWPAIPYYVLDKAAPRSVSENFYGEQADEQAALNEAPPLMIPIQVKITPPLQYLQKFGVEELQDAIALLSIGWLNANLPDFHPQIGDRILYHQVQMRVDTVKFADYFGNEQVPLHYFIMMENMSTGLG